MLKREKKSREDIGVDLYNAQQGLAKLQLTLERSHEQYSAIARMREGAEQDLQYLKQAYGEKKEELSGFQEKNAAYQAELDMLNANLKQVEVYNEQMKSEINVARRATYKAEENVANLEKGKMQQDYLIDSLQSQVVRLQEQLALYEAQLISQKQETTAASETLADASQEMESIAYEKKQLMQQWQSSLIGMGRRDEALRATEDAIRNQKEQLLALESELRGAKKSIEAEQVSNERLTGVKTRVEGEVTFLGRELERLGEKKTVLQENYSELKGQLEVVDAELGDATREGARFQEEDNATRKTIVAIAREHVGVQEEIERLHSQQVTLDKAAKSAKNVAKKTRDLFYEKERSLFDMQNELERVRVDGLNTQAHNKQLKAALDQILGEFKEQDAMIEKYEQEIRRRNDEIEKKQKAVDSLNRKYDALTSNVEDENTGPLEATIHNLQKNMHAVTEEINTMQHRWVKNQSDFVASVNTEMSQRDKIQEMKAELTVLQQKKMRIDAACNQQTDEVTNLHKAMDKMHLDMSRLNSLISKNSQSQQQLVESNLQLEQEFVAKLSEEEESCIKIESQIEAVREEKKGILNDIVEMERQALMLDRKIKLTKETQEALDPNVGRAETKAMEKEIHRMKLRYTQLMKRQEVLVQEMERAVNRREHISLKGKTKAKNTSQVGMTQAALGRKMNELRAKVDEGSKEVAAYQQDIKTFEDEADRLGNQADAVRNELNQLYEEEEGLQRDVVAGLVRKQLAEQKSDLYGRLAKRYISYGKNQYKSILTDDKIAEESSKQRERSVSLTSVVASLCAEFPSLEFVLEPLRK